jgi:hypothetical protein
VTYAIALAVWVASVLAGVIWGMGVGEDRFAARQLRDEHVAAVATEAAASAAAQAIANISIRNVTVNNELVREVQTREVFRDCRSGPVARELLNSTPGIVNPARPDAAASK